MKPGSLIVLFVLTCLMAIATTTMADEIRLKNGDRLTGKVVKMEGEEYNTIQIPQCYTLLFIIFKHFLINSHVVIMTKNFIILTYGITNLTRSIFPLV